MRVALSSLCHVVPPPQGAQSRSITSREAWLFESPITVRATLSAELRRMILRLRALIGYTRIYEETQLSACQHVSSTCCHARHMAKRCHAQNEINSAAVSSGVGDRASDQHMSAVTRSKIGRCLRNGLPVLW